MSNLKTTINEIMHALIIKIVLGMVVISLASYTIIPVKKGSVANTECLKINGLALGDDNIAIDGVNVRLFEKNEEKEWVDVTSVPYHDHEFSFTLEQDKNYMIEVSKKGFVTRSIIVSTALPENITPQPLFEYWFEVTMFKDKKGVDDYYMDFPVALIGYNSITGVFDNNHKYTHHIKSKIKEAEDGLMLQTAGK